MPLALVGQALAGTLLVLLAARLLFGLSFGILWVIAPGPRSRGRPGRGRDGAADRRFGRRAGSSGRCVAGGLADAADWRLASVALAVVMLPLIPLVARYASARGERRAAREPSPRARRSASSVTTARSPGRRSSAACSESSPASRASSFRSRSRGNGLSAGEIGLAFGISAAVWIASAALVGRLRASAVHLRGVGIAVAVLAGAWLLPAFRLSTLALVALPRRLDGVPLDDQRPQLRRRRASERGQLGADGDRRDESRLGRDGARDTPRSRASPRAARVRIAFAATGAAALCVAVALLAAAPASQDRCTPIVIVATVAPDASRVTRVSELFPPLR